MPELDSLRQAHHDGVLRDLPLSQVAAERWDGTASTTNSAPSIASSGSLTARNDAGSGDSREIVGIAMLDVDLVSEFRPPCPEGHLIAGVGQNHREGGAPGTRAHYCDARPAPGGCRLAHVRSPVVFSLSGS